MSKFNYVLLIIAFVIASFVFGFFTFFVNHTAKADVTKTYTLDYPFDKVKRVMMQVDVLEEMVAYEQGQILEKNWTKLLVSGDRPLLEGVDIDGNLDFLVLKQDPELGRALMRFSEVIYVGKHKINSETSLVEPVAHLQAIKTIMEMSPEGDKTVVKTSASLTYQRRIPKNMVDEVNRRVNQSAEQMLSNNKEVITMLVGKYADKRFVIPFKRKK